MHSLPGAIHEGIYAKAPSERICPPQARRPILLLLAKQEKQGGSHSTFRLRCQESEVANCVTIVIGHVFGQLCNEVCKGRRSLDDTLRF
jgi:hypothetical protein